MKTATLLILISFTASISTAYANEPDGSGDDVNAYCTEQAQLAGIEDAAELGQYVQECVDSYTMPAGEQQ
jgi:hypothetical protein